jgi:hypothetical protein
VLFERGGKLAGARAQPLRGVGGELRVEESEARGDEADAKAGGDGHLAKLLPGADAGTLPPRVLRQG